MHASASRPVAAAAPAAFAGRILRTVFAGMLVLRRPRPIHARGELFDGTVRWLRGPRDTGLGWVDDPEPGSSVPVRARLSRSLGLPDGLPDVWGLALRVPGSDAGGAQDDLDLRARAADADDAHIEFASTGAGVPLRFALVPHRRPERARLGILLPYRGTRGPVLLLARTIAGDPHHRLGWRLLLSTASPLGRWRAFAELELRPSPDQDDALRFDAGRHPLPGSDVYPWVRALRQPSYDRVQRAGA